MVPTAFGIVVSLLHPIFKHCRLGKFDKAFSRVGELVRELHDTSRITSPKKGGRIKKP
tara:strand:- start:571 stop:744 length:174 start_codon:yes stop_codon:yes gene_type:complete